MNKKNNIEEPTVIFKLGEQYLGVPITLVKEITRVPQITPIPCSVNYLQGITNLRGKVLPVISLRRRLQMPEAEKEERNRVILIETGASIFGITVDEVVSIQKLQQEDIEDTVKHGSKEMQDLISGIGKTDEQLVLILDVRKLAATIKKAV